MSPSGVGGADEDTVAYAGVEGQAALLRAGSLTSAGLVELLLARIARLDPALNAFHTVFTDRARTDAADADRARAAGDTRPLLGVPIAIKDNVGVAGHAAQFGTGSPEPAAGADGEVVARLRAAGLVLIGTTNLPELALWAATESSTHGVTRNPWDRDRAPGGSSGGSAAAVAAGLVPAAYATDGLGSIRIPASSCGLVGLKPTRGLVPMGPDPDHWHGLSHAGFLTRTVRDTALLLDIAVAPAPGFAADLDGPGPLRIAVSAKPSSPVRVDPRVRRVLDETAQTLRGLGHDVAERDPAYGLGLPNGNSARYLAGVAADLAGLANPAAVERSTAAVARLGRRVPARAVRWGRGQGEAFAGRMAEFFRTDDVLVTPTVARLPARAGSITGRSLGAVLRRMLPYAAFTGPWNGSGLPALSVPVGTAGALPVGVQLVGPAGSEAMLLSLAAQLEEATGWRSRRPPLDHTG